jgi:hypothetical protein
LSDRYSRILQNKKPDTSGQPMPAQPQTPVDHAVDPRPDLYSDHLFWVDLLINSKHLYPETFTTFHGLRCSGAILQKTETSFKLLPGKENSPDDWEATKQKWLDPIKDKLIHLFQVTSMGRMEDAQLPHGAFTGQKPGQQTSLRDAWLKGGS